MTWRHFHDLGTDITVTSCGLGFILGNLTGRPLAGGLLKRLDVTYILCFPNYHRDVRWRRLKYSEEVIFAQNRYHYHDVTYFYGVARQPLTSAQPMRALRPTHL